MLSPVNPIELLPHTFEAFLSRFGRLTEIQTLSLEPLLAGRNCVLTAATAGGKTEAALAPILERFQKKRFLTKPASTVKFLYLVPTKALARDIARRIEQPLAKLSIPFCVKTGDESAFKAKSEFLITTPESLDSMLANRPKVLCDVRAVILDELHLYDNTPRGDQLRILLNRLRRLRKYAFQKGDSLSDEMQFCGLSATVHNPVNVAAQYFSEPLWIETKGQRQIDAEILEFIDVQSLTELFGTFKERNIKKVLTFCQSRSECESFVNLLRGSLPFGENVLVHHANLSANIRHQTEEKFSQAGAALCFATSTLELGIDIGDVDLILLIGSPDNLGSFLQRIGRGNRRTNRTAVVCFYQNLTEAAIFKVFLRAAVKSDAETIELLKPHNNLRFRPSVIVQQLCSYLKQTTFSELNTEHAYGLFQTPQGEPLIDKSQYDKIVQHLVDKDFLRPSGNGRNIFQAGDVWEKLYEERRIYSNLSGTNESLAVIDDLTGRTLGYVDTSIAKNKTFLINGHSREVIGYQGRKILTREVRFAKKIHQPRQKLVWRNKSVALTRALAKELGFPVVDGDIPFKLVTVQNEELTEKRILLFHNSGEVFGKSLAKILEDEKNVSVIEDNEFFIEIADEISVEKLTISPIEIKRMLHKNWKIFEKAYDLGVFQTDLPNEVRMNATIESFNL